MNGGKYYTFRYVLHKLNKEREEEQRKKEEEERKREEERKKAREEERQREYEKEIRRREENERLERERIEAYNKLSDEEKEELERKRIEEEQREEQKRIELQKKLEQEKIKLQRKIERERKKEEERKRREEETEKERKIKFEQDKLSCVRELQANINQVRERLNSGEQLSPSEMEDAFKIVITGPSGNKDVLMKLIENGSLKNENLKHFIEGLRWSYYDGQINNQYAKKFENINKYEDLYLFSYDNNGQNEELYGGIKCHLDREILNCFYENKINVENFVDFSRSKNGQDVVDFFTKDFPKRKLNKIIYKRLAEFGFSSDFEVASELVKAGHKLHKIPFKFYLFKEESIPHFIKNVKELFNGEHFKTFRHANKDKRLYFKELLKCQNEVKQEKKLQRQEEKKKHKEQNHQTQIVEEAVEQKLVVEKSILKSELKPAKLSNTNKKEKTSQRKAVEQVAKKETQVSKEISSDSLDNSIKSSNSNENEEIEFDEEIDL